MRTFAAIAFLVACVRTVAAQASEIPKGAHVLLRMENSISTKTAGDGDFVYFRTASPIAGKGRILVPTGSYVQGVVGKVKRSGRVSGRAELAIHLETLTFPNGRVVKFTPKLSSVDPGPGAERVKDKEGEIEVGSTAGQDVRRISVTAGSGAAIGGLADHSWEGAGIGAGIGTGVGVATALLTRGRELELRRGTALDVVFDRDMTLEPQ
jgi:hypothetical protein